MSNCDFRGDWCTTHNKPRCTAATYCETGFYDPADWKDIMSDEQHRQNVDAATRGLVRDIKRCLSWSCSKIREKTDEDRQIEAVLVRLGAELARLEKLEPKRKTRSRR